MVIYSVIHKRVFTPPRDLTTWIIEAIDHSSNSTLAFTKYFTSRIFCKCKCHCWVWRMVDNLYYSSRKIPERCENSFVNYRINYQKLCIHYEGFELSQWHFEEKIVLFVFLRFCLKIILNFLFILLGFELEWENYFVNHVLSKSIASADKQSEIFTVKIIIDWLS